MLYELLSVLCDYYYCLLLWYCIIKYYYMYCLVLFVLLYCFAAFTVHHFFKLRRQALVGLNVCLSARAYGFPFGCVSGKSMSTEDGHMLYGCYSDLPLPLCPLLIRSSVNSLLCYCYRYYYCCYDIITSVLHFDCSKFFFIEFFAFCLFTLYDVPVSVFPLFYFHLVYACMCPSPF